MLHRHSTHPLETAATIPALQPHGFLIPTASGLKTKLNFSIIFIQSHSGLCFLCSLPGVQYSHTKPISTSPHHQHNTPHALFSDPAAEDPSFQSYTKATSSTVAPRNIKISSLPREQISAYAHHFNNSLLNGSSELVFLIQD